MPIAAIVGAVGALGGAAITANAADSAAKTAGQAAAANTALQSQIYGSNRAMAQPYVDAGTSALDELQGFLGLRGDPAASQAALDRYLNSTGYRFTRDQGTQAVEQAQLARGMGLSGSTLKALDAYGNGLAQQYGQQYAQALKGLADTGQSAAAALAGQGQTYASAVSSNANAAAAASGAAAATTAGAANSALAAAIQAFSGRGASSYGGSNAFGGGTNGLYTAGG